MPTQWFLVLWGGGGLLTLRPRKLCSSSVLRRINLHGGCVCLHSGCLYCVGGGGGLVNLRHRKLCSSTVLGQIYDLVSQLLISGTAHHFLSFLFENW